MMKGCKTGETAVGDGREGRGMWERRKFDKLKRKKKIDVIRWERDGRKRWEIGESSPLSASPN